MIKTSWIKKNDIIPKLAVLKNGPKLHRPDPKASCVQS